MSCFKEKFCLITKTGELIRGEHREHSTGRVYAIVIEFPYESLLSIELNKDELQELTFKLNDMLKEGG